MKGKIMQEKSEQGMRKTLEARSLCMVRHGWQHLPYVHSWKSLQKNKMI